MSQFEHLKRAMPLLERGRDAAWELGQQTEGSVSFAARTTAKTFDAALADIEANRKLEDVLLAGVQKATKAWKSLLKMDSALRTIDGALDRDLVEWKKNREQRPLAGEVEVCEWWRSGVSGDPRFERMGDETVAESDHLHLMIDVRTFPETRELFTRLEKRARAKLRSLSSDWEKVAARCHNFTIDGVEFQFSLDFVSDDGDFVSLEARCDEGQTLPEVVRHVLQSP